MISKRKAKIEKAAEEYVKKNRDGWKLGVSIVADFAISQVEAQIVELRAENNALKAKAKSHLRDFTRLENKIGAIYQITGLVQSGDEIESARQLKAENENLRQSLQNLGY